MIDIELVGGPRCGEVRLIPEMVPVLVLPDEVPAQLSSRFPYVGPASRLDDERLVTYVPDGNRHATAVGARVRYVFAGWAT